MKSEVYDKAITFFQRASQLEPSDVKWQLMIASCHRRMRNYQQSLEIYQEVHRKEPENIECLRYIVQICNDLGLKQEVDEYATKLRRAEESSKNKNFTEDQTDILLSEQSVYKLPSKHHNSYDPLDSPRLDDSSSLFQVNSKIAKKGSRMDESYDTLDSKPSIRKKISQTAEDDWGEDEISDDMLPL